MTHYLVLVDAPIIGTPALADFERLAAAPESSFHVVVPARRLDAVERSFVEMEANPADAGDAAEVVAARWRLLDAVSTLERAGLTVVGEVGVESPVESIEQVLERGSFYAVVVVTSPAGIVGWVNLDLASRIERHVTEPVVVIEIEPAADSS